MEASPFFGGPASSLGVAVAAADGFRCGRSPQSCCHWHTLPMLLAKALVSRRVDICLSARSTCAVTQRTSLNLEPPLSPPTQTTSACRPSEAHLVWPLAYCGSWAELVLAVVARL